MVLVKKIKFLHFWIWWSTIMKDSESQNFRSQKSIMADLQPIKNFSFFGRFLCYNFKRHLFKLQLRSYGFLLIFLKYPTSTSKKNKKTHVTLNPNSIMAASKRSKINFQPSLRCHYSAQDFFGPNFFVEMC